MTLLFICVGNGTYHICEELDHRLEHLKDSGEFLCHVGRQAADILQETLSVLGVCSQDSVGEGQVACLSGSGSTCLQLLEQSVVHRSRIAGDKALFVLHCNGSVEGRLQ